MNLMDSFQTSIYFLNINFVFSFLFSNFNFALFNYFFDRINLSFLKLVNLSLKKYLNYRYFSYSAFINISYVGLNFKKMRDLRELGVRGANSLIGFKMLCLGRFSRKQRVRKIFYSDFKMPLSKISADIDYNFRVVPLLNSATSIKV